LCISVEVYLEVVVVDVDDAIGDHLLVVGILRVCFYLILAKTFSQNNWLSTGILLLSY
jgi:hypothetical protein